MTSPTTPSAIPGRDAESAVLGWINEAIEEGDAFLKAQPGYTKIPETIRAVMGDGDDAKSLNLARLSSTSSNRVAKAFFDLAAMQTDIKPFWEYRTLNKRYERQAQITGKLAAAWYTQRQIDQRFVEAVMWHEVGGTGWTHQYWDPDLQDLSMEAIDPRDVLPIRPSSYGTIQDAFGVVIRQERTVNYLRRRFPKRASEIVADRDGSASSPTQQGRFGRLLDQIVSPFWTYMERQGTASRMLRIPTCDLYTVYLRDPAINKTGHTLAVGEFTAEGQPATNWSYLVQPGDPIYPRRRCIIATHKAILYDGPNIYWHGKFPVSKLTLKPLPFSWLGQAPLWSALPLQRSLATVLRVIDDHLDQVAQPAVLADKNSVAKAELDAINTRRAGMKLRQNPLAGKGVQIVPPPPLDAMVAQHRDWIVNEINQLTGVQDMSQLMRLNQIPSGDTIDRMMEALTPSVRMASRSIEAFMREFAEIAGYNFAQFYTLPRRLTILGPDGVTPEDFDFDPGSFIPDYTSADDLREDGTPTAEALARGPLPRLDRAQAFLRQFQYHIAPGSLLASSEIERKLMYLQLARAGLIDHWTLLEVLGIPNVGEPPPGAENITARLQAEQEMGIGMAISATGRKATGQSMPRLTVKES